MHFGICAFSWQSPLTPSERLRLSMVMEICLGLFSHSDVLWNRRIVESLFFSGYARTDDSDALEFWIRSYIYCICWITEVSEILCNFTNANPFTLRLRFIASQVSTLRVRNILRADLFSIRDLSQICLLGQGQEIYCIFRKNYCI